MEITPFWGTVIGIAFALIMAYPAFYFFRNTIKKKDWKMFVWVGVIGLLVGGLFIYTTWL